jgi:hypothetical protein
MKTLSTIFLTAIILVSGAQPATAARVNIVHGIDGRDLALGRSLPVDIAVNGVCSLTGVTFKQSALVDLSPATYTITVHLSDGVCAQAPVISKVITVDDGYNSLSAVASLSSGGAPQLVLFNNSRDLFLPSAVTVRHVAKAGPVFVKFSSRELARSQTKRIRNGKSSSLLVLTDKLQYTANIQASASGGAIARKTGVGARKFTIHNIVGSQANGFSIITERLSP